MTQLSQIVALGGMFEKHKNFNAVGLEGKQTLVEVSTHFTSS